MQGLFSNLQSVLTEQLTSAGRLHEAVERQIAALRTNNLDDLQSAVNEVMACGAELERLENSRGEVQARLEQETGLPGGATLRELIPRAPAAMQGPLAVLREALAEELQAISEAGSFAQTMSARGLQLTTALVRLLGGGEGGTYSPGGSIQGPGPGGSFDQSV